MIKNERQLAMTRSALSRFEEALTACDEDDSSDPLVRELETAALYAEAETLRAQIEDYVALQSGTVPVGMISSLDDIPLALIRARVAAGLTQQELATRLGLKAQQIQRYESSDYQTASLKRLKEVADALELSWPPVTVDAEERLRELGFSNQFVTRRMGGGRQMPLAVAARVARVFGLDLDAPTTPPRLELAGQFKSSAAQVPAASAYAVYACYLAQLVADCVDADRPRPVPTDPVYWQEELGTVDYRDVLAHAWSLGLAVLPLDDPGEFHGAVWRVRGRNVVVLKQRSRLASRWLFDLLHELFHATESPDEQHFGVYEDGVPDQDEEVERAANAYAGNAVLRGRAEPLALEAVARTKGRIQKLKEIVPGLAAEAGVPTGALAQYLAWRLSLQGLDWWGAAHNLEREGTDPYDATRRFLLDRLDLSRLNPVDRALLEDALNVGRDHQ